MIGLSLKADLDGVTDFTFDDTPVNAYYFTFKIACGGCHEVHPKPVRFQMHEKIDLPNTRGEANFTFKCNFCGKDNNNLSVVGPLAKYTAEDSGKSKQMVAFDSRGVVLEEFLADQTPFLAKGTGSKPTPFKFEFEDGEWYDYDESAETEVSITNTEWTIHKIK